MGFNRKFAVILLGVLTAISLTGCKNDAYVQFKTNIGDSYALTYNSTIDYEVKNKKVFEMSADLGGKYSIVSKNDSKIQAKLDINSFASQCKKDNKEIYRIGKMSYDTINIYKKIISIDSNVELDSDGNFIACTLDGSNDVSQYLNVEEMASYFSGVMNGFNKTTLVEGVEFDNSSEVLNNEISNEFSELGIENKNLMFKEKIESVTSNWATITYHAESKLDNADMEMDVKFIVDVRTGVCTQCDWKLVLDRVKIQSMSNADYGTLTIKSNTEFK